MKNVIADITRLENEKDEVPSYGANSADLLLATDLDGTLLGGSTDERSRLLDLLNEIRNRTLLIFVTGRGLESIIPVLNDPLVPDPDYIIADVGSTIVRTEDLEPVEPLQSRVSAGWPGTSKIVEALKEFEGIERQEVPQERRCSFYMKGMMEPGSEFVRRVRDLKCEILISAGRYLDILPEGVSKGSTLKALVDLLETDSSRVVVAGDTLNDLSLFQTGYRGIVVGNAEKALLDETRSFKNTYFSSSHGAGGITEGLIHYGMLSDQEAIRHSKPPENTVFGNHPFVIVYHRLPFDEEKKGKKTIRQRPKSPNGVIPSILGVLPSGKSVCWVAWSKQENRTPSGFDPVVHVNRKKHPNVVASRIPLTSRDVKLFYEKFSKEAFWPIIFSFPTKATFNEKHWEHYLEINRIFAEKTAAEAAEQAVVWIHDYNLWMVPAYLRPMRPDLRIGFFHHTSFPAPDVFSIIPWHRKIVGSLLQCDYVGFHIPRYVENFADVVRSCSPTKTVEQTSCAPRYITYGCALGVDTMTTQLETGGRTVRIGANPVGIDTGRIRKLVETESVRGKIESIRSEIRDRVCILSLERLDYVKGPLEKLAAFQKLLECHPELHGKVVLLNVVTPPAPGMAVYRSIRDKVDQAVGRINGQFGKLDWTPVRYFYRSLGFEDVLAYYAVSDVAWITPLRDGLNLVAKEYISTKEAVDGKGVLILSEFAGAAVELHGAVLTNPYDSSRMKDDLYHALVMDPADRSERLKRMTDIVNANDVSNWGSESLREIESSHPVATKNFEPAA